MNTGNNPDSTKRLTINCTIPVNYAYRFLTYLTVIGYDMKAGNKIFAVANCYAVLGFLQIPWCRILMALSILHRRFGNRLQSDIG
jgi:hypothetical protein